MVADGKKWSTGKISIVVRTLIVGALRFSPVEPDQCKYNSVCIHGDTVVFLWQYNCVFMALVIGVHGITN